jgi:hypothetical protein
MKLPSVNRKKAGLLATGLASLALAFTPQKAPAQPPSSSKQNVTTFSSRQSGNFLWVNSKDEKTPDFDGDRKIGFNDFLMFAPNYGISNTHPGWDERYDLDNNGSISFPDFLKFAESHGKITNSDIVGNFPQTSYQTSQVDATLNPFIEDLSQRMQDPIFNDPIGVRVLSSKGVNIVQKRNKDGERTLLEITPDGLYNSTDNGLAYVEVEGLKDGSNLVQRLEFDFEKDEEAIRHYHNLSRYNKKWPSTPEKLVVYVKNSANPGDGFHPSTWTGLPPSREEINEAIKAMTETTYTLTSGIFNGKNIEVEETKDPNLLWDIEKSPSIFYWDNRGPPGTTIDTNKNGHIRSSSVSIPKNSRKSLYHHEAGNFLGLSDAKDNWSIMFPKNGIFGNPEVNTLHKNDIFAGTLYYRTNN